VGRHYARRLAVFREPGFLGLREVLQSADARFANLESMVVRYVEGTPALRTGTHMVTEPELLEDIKWFGFNMLSCANGHWLNSAKKVCCKTATWKYPNPSAPASNGGTAWVSFAPRKR